MQQSPVWCFSRQAPPQQAPLGQNAGMTRTSHPLDPLLVAADSALRAHFVEASHEETDHLAWTRQRLDELGARPSVLNPFWYAGAFGLGLVAGRLGDPWSLGFVAETERQVEAHLDSHLGRLPAGDTESRAVVEQMKTDEARHAAEAVSAGAAELPAPAKALMRLTSRVMTTVAHLI